MYHNQSPVLAEFVGNGGGNGVPLRSAVDPDCPPYLELRPHPLRETQVGKSLITMACTDTQLWAAQQNGVIRVWNFSDAYDHQQQQPGIPRGDEEAAPFYECAHTCSRAMCLVVDSGTKLIWSGHEDGKIRSWKMDAPFQEALSWQAHPAAPILSMVFSSCGDLWTGSKGGVLKIWPWEAIGKSLSLSPLETHTAPLLLESSSIDLRSQVTVNGLCNISSSDVKCLLSDNIRGKLWAAGSLTFSLWNARTRELLKVYNVDGQIQNRVDMSLVQEQAVTDEINLEFVSMSKQKSPSSNFLQWSRNAIMVAADGVHQFASKGAGKIFKDTKTTEALVITVDGMIWSGCSNGLLVQWDGNGNRIQDFHHHPCAVQCFCTYGSRIWVGYVSGIIHLLDLDGKVIAGWVAQSSPVIKLVVWTGYVFSLATHGGIRGWSIASPGPLDNILRRELAGKELIYTRQENVKILVGTWNVGEGRASHNSLVSWLGSVVSDVGIVVVGLQEVEMGAGFLAMSAVKETLGLEGSAIGQWWQDKIGKTLDEGSSFERLGSRQLAGLLIAIWVRKNLTMYIGDVEVAAVTCGLGRAIGNKGGVGLRLRVYDRIMCFVNCHLAAHLEAVDCRNADFDHIHRTMVFSNSSNLLCPVVPYLLLSCFLGFSTYIFWQLYSSGLPLVLSVATGILFAVQMLRYTNVPGIAPEAGKPELAEADIVVFLGDFNYRLFRTSYDEVRESVKQRSFDWLLEKDQLRAEMKAGKVFQGMREALIRFPPTYKFERGKAGLEGYDSGEKKRIPAWCDRIVYRDNRPASAVECNLQCPVLSSILEYEACMDVTESDHKPVRCKFNVEIAHVDRSRMRLEFGKIVKSNNQTTYSLEDLRHVPEIVVSTNSIVLQNQDSCILSITNKSGKCGAIFQIICIGQSTAKDDGNQSEYCARGSFGFPYWLEITPAGGIIKPGEFVEVLVHHNNFHTPEELSSRWNEDTRDKEVMLLINVQGSCSMETTSYQVQVLLRYQDSLNRFDK